MQRSETKDPNMMSRMSENYIGRHRRRTTNYCGTSSCTDRIVQSEHFVTAVVLNNSDGNKKPSANYNYHNYCRDQQQHQKLQNSSHSHYKDNLHYDSSHLQLDSSQAIFNYCGDEQSDSLDSCHCCYCINLNDYCSYCQPHQRKQRQEKVINYFPRTALVYPTPSFLSTDDSSSSKTDRAADSNDDCVLRPNRSLEQYYGVNLQRFAIYENLCQRCGYGIGCNCTKFEKTSVSVASTTAENRTTSISEYTIESDLYVRTGGCYDVENTIIGDNDSCNLIENIYENICDTCSFIYSGDKCQVCENQQQLQKKTVATAATKQLNKFAELLGNLRQRLREKTATTTSRRRHQNQRPEIVHNIDDVYRTNKTFDLSEIARLKREEILSQNTNVVTDGKHIYGKLRCSDEHLVAIRRQDSINNSKTPITKIKATVSDSNFFEKSRLSFAACVHSTFSLPKQKQNKKKIEALYENLPIKLLIDSSDTSSISTIPYEEQTILSSLDIHIPALRNWMTSLRRQTYDYDDDTKYVACTVKCIPSKYVSCCEYMTGITGMHEYMSNDIDDNKNDTENIGAMRFEDNEVWTRVDQFRTNLIENQTKRTSAYFKQHTHKNNYNSIIIHADSAPSIHTSNMESDENIVTSISKKCVVANEREDLRSMYENSNTNESNSCANKILAKVISNKQVNIDVGATAIAASHSLYSNAEILHVSQRKQNSKAITCQARQQQYGQLNQQHRRPSIDTFLNEAILQHIITQLALSTGLNRSTFVYDKRLYTFLTALINNPYKIINYPDDMYDMVIMFNKAHDIQSTIACQRSRTNINNISIRSLNKLKYTSLSLLPSPVAQNEKVNLNDFDFILHPRCIVNSTSTVKRIDDFEKIHNELMACKKTVIEDFQRPNGDNDQMRPKKTVNDFQIREKSKNVGDNYSSTTNSTMANNDSSGRLVGGYYKEDHEIKIRNHNVKGIKSSVITEEATTAAGAAAILFNSACELNSDESIYQSIWKFQTVGSARESDVSFISEYYTASEFCEEIVDVAEWEVAEEFSFATERNSQLIDLSDAVSSDDNHGEEPPSLIYDPYRTVCIIYNENNSKHNKIIYDYNGNDIYAMEVDGKEVNEDDTKHIDKIDLNEKQTNKEKTKVNEPERQMTTEFTFTKDDAIAFSGKFIDYKESNDLHKYENYDLGVGNSVVAWHKLIRSVAYMEDEEDMMLPESFLLENLAQSKNEKNSSSLEKAFNGINSMVSSNESLSDAPLCKFYEKQTDDEVNRNSKIVSTTPQPEAKSKRDLGFLNKLQYKRFDVSKTNKKDDGIQGLFYKNLDAKSTNDVPNDFKKAKINVVFGVDLNDVEKDEKYSNIPKFVVECIKIIELEENIQTNGIYRASGKKESIDKLKKKMNESKLRKSTKYVTLKDEDIHTVTGALKQFFRELKTDLIPVEIVKRLPDDFENVDNLSKIRIEMDTIDFLPRECLKYLLKHLIFVDKNSEYNLMNASNLSIVWGACIFISSVTAADTIETSDLMKKNKLFKILIQKFYDIFPDAN